MIKSIIETEVRKTIAASGLTYFREPLVGYAAADDSIFQEFKIAVGPNHLLPRDILPEARSVVAFYLPFQNSIVRNNRSGELASREWAQVYVATNQLISEICNNLQLTLAKSGIQFRHQPPTYVFDTEQLISTWSHKHIAFACGLGSFGRNSLLITAKGCAGRFGSGVLDAILEPTPRKLKTHFCQADSGACANYCATVCPAGAIGPHPFNRRTCYQKCQENDSFYHDLGSCEVCGKCATGPCGFFE